MSVRLRPELNDQVAAIDEGIKAADEGRVVAHEDVVAWVRSRGQPDEIPMPKCG
ncbi:MAG TPA: CopG family transcriptional regulator [Acetobacteraceae bacterium]